MLDQWFEGKGCAMSFATGPTSEVEVPALRQDVVDELVHHLGRDDRAGFEAAEANLEATRAEVAAASAGLVESRSLDLAALEHTLEVLEDVAQLPAPPAAPTADPT